MANFTVRRNRRYRATIQLGLIEQLAGNDTIANALRDAGFTEVSVAGNGSMRHAQARWPEDDASAPLPSQIISVAEIEEA